MVKQDLNMSSSETNVQSLNNSRFGDYLHLIYPNNLEVKNTIDTQMSVFYLDFHLDIAKEEYQIKSLREI